MADASNEAQQIDAVHQAFADDADIAPYADALSIDAGDPWRVSGDVGSVVARRRAVRVARRALPGQDVEDGVRLSPVVTRSDSALSAALQKALNDEPAFSDVPVLETGQRPPQHDAHYIAVMVRDGIVYLGGRLDLAGKSLAEGIAWETGACSDVHNLISREPGSADPDDELAVAVRTLIEQHTALEPEAVVVTVERGEVELRAEIDNTRQRDTLVSLCWLLPGVSDVNDRMVPRLG